MSKSHPEDEEGSFSAGILGRIHFASGMFCIDLSRLDCCIFRRNSVFKTTTREHYDIFCAFDV
jgi:hypothetical protein